MKKREHITAFLGKGTELEGKLSFHGTTRIDGHFKGEISSDGTLIVSEEAMIEATIHTSNIVIYGGIHGDVTADNRVEIHAPSKVFGNIQAPALVVDEGGILEGMTRVFQPKKSGETESAGIVSDDYVTSPSSTLTTLYGIITDQETGSPIKNATVNCNGVGKRKTETNASGFYELGNLRDGTCELKIKAKGYKKERAEVEILGERRYEQNLELAPKKKK